MKKAIILVVGLVSFVSLAEAQKLPLSKVPVAVKNKFSGQHPEVKDVNWEKEKSAYEAVFKLNGRKMSENYAASGNLLESEKGLAITELPKSVLDFLAIHHKGLKVKEAAKITKANGQIQYEAEIGGKDFLFDEKGNPIN